MSWILLCLVGLLVALQQVDSSGVFELRLKSFINSEGKDDLGRCCNGVSQTNDCDGHCQPRFVICLKEFQTKIDTTSRCTFGNTSTSVLVPYSNHTLPQDNLNNPIRLAFNFTWHGSFSLVVEMWYGDLTSTSGGVITRLTRGRWLDVNDKWTLDEHNSTHSSLRFEYRVTCAPQYYGKKCEIVCRPRDDSFGHYTCSSTGNRVCHTGWTGDYCTSPRCSLGCDGQHGQCTIPNECKCQIGWQGPNCTECERHPGCLHGTCSKPWECNCKEGWGGLFCNQDLNFCTNHKPCRNGGTCFNTGQGSFTCNCPAGFTGTECEIAVNNCSHIPCLNGGTCVKNGTNHSCVCLPGFYGPRCEPSPQSCDDKPCHNQGLCIRSGQGYSCQCKPGFNGDHCENQINDCLSNPCFNNGSCVDGINGYVCKCQTGFTGLRCEVNIDDCKDRPCLNGGSCIDRINGFRCQCVPGFAGPLCQENVDLCLTKPCANGGTCNRLLNDYKCECAPGFKGKDCSLEINECRSHPCHNGGKCVNRIHGFECYCPIGFLGATCEEAASSARISSESNLTTEHVVVIATVSTFVPLLVLVAVGVIICLKQRRKREKARADEEARLQNEQNTAHSSFAKRGAAMAAESHMIKNSWGQCTNNILTPSSLTPSDDCSVSNVNVGEDCFPKHLHQVIDGRPVYTLQRSRSQKQLNTDLGARASALLVTKIHEPDYEHIKRLSVMSSNSSTNCGTSDPSLLKRPLDKDPSGVFVIEPHFHPPDAITQGLFATEV